MDNEYDKSKRKFGPFKFTGIVRKRAIHVYNISLDLLKKGRKFEVIELSKNKCSFFIGNKGKLVRFYEHDRSIRFHVPHKLIQDFNKRVAVDIYTDDEELASLFKHVMGLVRLKTNNFWFKSDSSRKFPQSTQITISSRALTDYFFKKGIKTVYIDKRKNYLIVKPINYTPSRTSFISKVWIHDHKANDKVEFFVPGMCDIKYFCLDVNDFKISRRSFQTKEEFELASELIKRHPVLCISTKQTQDIQLLSQNERFIKTETVINLKNIKTNSTNTGGAFSDIFKGILFHQEHKTNSFLILNKEWRKYANFRKFGNIDILKFSEDAGVKVLFTDYKDGWAKSLSEKIEKSVFF